VEYLRAHDLNKLDIINIVKYLLYVLFALPIITGCGGGGSSAADGGILATANVSKAQTPCDFKGLSVGDKMPPSQIMSKLGISKYKTNPKFDFPLELTQKHGTVGAMELLESKIGPYCNDSSCQIPNNFKVGAGIDASVFVLFNSNTNQIQAVNVRTNTTYWSDLVEILKRKYGQKWVLEESDFAITNYHTDLKIPVQRYIMTHKTGGINPKTGDTCQISAVNYDYIFSHPGPLGLYQSVFEIKLISSNF